MKIDIEYIYHSCYKLEINDKLLVFDYFKGDLTLKDKKAYFFVSHAHADHYNDEIFRLGRGLKDTKYILSDDVNYSEAENIFYMSPYEMQEIDGISVKTFGSTDAGVSFLVNVDDINIFFAGDLNWWHWYDESDADNKRMEIEYKEEIKKLFDETIDIAFVPVDPRLREGYSLGGDYFIEKIKPRFLFPLHFGEGYAATCNFSLKHKSSSTQVVSIEEVNQQFSILI